MQTARSKRQRIKRGELVQFVFSMFSLRYERTSVDSIYDIAISVAEIRMRLSELYETTYQNDWWILTQIHRYEREIGTKLFERVDTSGDTDEIVLAIHQGIDGFRETHHLLANQKLRIANGVLDLITHTSERRPGPLSLYLGSGSIPATVADVLIHNIQEHGGAYRIFSHNLAVQETVLAKAIGNDSVDFYSLGGKVDSIKYISLSEEIVDHIDPTLGYVIQSTNTISNGRLYVTDPKEARLKGAILHDLPGVKILAVMKDEFPRSPHNKVSYGRLSDYDYIVTIPSKHGTIRQADRFLEERSDRFITHVSHWSYTVYRVAAYRQPVQSLHPAFEWAPVTALL